MMKYQKKSLEHDYKVGDADHRKTMWWKDLVQLSVRKIIDE